MDTSQVTITSSGVCVDCNNPPQVSVALLKKSDLPSLSKPWDDIELPVDMLLLTVSDCEFLSCIAYLNPGFYKSYHQNFGYVYLGKMGEVDCMKVAVMACFVGSAGPDGSFIAVKNAVLALRPKCVFSVGFCSGLNYRKVKLGDVVISGEYLTERRSTGIPLSSPIATVIKRAADGWRPPLIDPEKMEVQVHTGGVFLSGTEELNNVERHKELVERFPEAIAIVTESEGERFETLL